MNIIAGLTFQSVGFDVKGKPEYSTSVTSCKRRELHQEQAQPTPNLFDFWQDLNLSQISGCTPIMQ